jgi:dipeptidyl aminopeptidase/acylaminoacyl peptidase
MPDYKDFLPELRIRPDVAISSDGRQVAYIDDATGQFNVRVQPLSGEGQPRQVTSYVESAVRRVAWHPSGRYLIYTADANGDEKTQVYRADLTSAESKPLTRSPGVQFHLALGDPVSPDGLWLAYAGNDRSPSDQDVLIQHLLTGETRRLYADGGRAFAGYWSPDGEWLTVTEWRDGNSDHLVYLVPASGGAAQLLTPPDMQATYWLGPWLPDGSGFLVRSNVGREFTGLAVMNPRTGDLSWLDTPDWDVEQVAMSTDGDMAVWTVNVDGISNIRARRLSTGADLHVDRLPAGKVSGLTADRSGATLVLAFDSPGRPLNIGALSLADQTIRWLTDSYPAAARSAQLVEPELIRYRSGDGELIPAYLYVPQEATSPQPVVLFIHGGPSYQERPIYNALFQHLVSQGVAVLAPNARGSTGYGISYKRRLHRDWGGIDLGDWAAAVEFLRHQAWVDKTRVAVMGGSYGGFGALSCLARRPDLDWAAGVAICAPANLVTFTRSQPATWRSTVRTMIGDPDQDHDLLMSRSPITYAGTIRAPVLVIQGANDPRVPKQESDQMVEALRSRGLDVRYEVLPDEGHGFLKRENQIMVHSDACEFLLTRLERAKPPAGQRSPAPAP